jgi:hypothetical protein
LTVCHAINIAMTVVLPLPVAIFIAIRSSSGFACSLAPFEGSEPPEGIDADRVVWIKRVLIEPTEMPEETLPEITEASPAIERAAPPSFHRQLLVPEQGIV